MSESVTCPNCRRPVPVAADQGDQEVQCPGCGTRFVGKAAGEDAIQAGPGAGLPAWGELWGNEAEDRGAFAAEGDLAGLRLRRGVGDPSAWAKVRNGITLVLIGMCCRIGLGLAAGFCIGGMGAAAVGGRAPDLNTALTVIYAITFADLALQLLTVVGYGLCIAAPSAFGLKGLGIATFALGAGGLVLTLLAVAADLLGGAGLRRHGVAAFNQAADTGAMELVSSVLGVALIFVFLCFLRGVALAWEAPWLASSIRGLMILVGVVIAVTISFVVASAAMGVALLRDGFGQGFGGANAQVGGAGALVIGMGCLLIVGVLGALIWFLIVLGQTRSVIRMYP